MRLRPWLVAAAAFGAALAVAAAVRFGLPAFAEVTWILVVVATVTGYAASANVALQPTGLSEAERMGVVAASAIALFVVLFRMAPPMA